MIFKRKSSNLIKCIQLPHSIMRIYILSAIILCITTNLALVQCIQNETNIEGGEGGLVFTNPSSIKPNDDPENIRDIVVKAKNNEIMAEMITNKTRAMVSCETGEMLVRINFTEPFRGVGYTDDDISSPCKFFGTGGTYYEMRLPLKGCGTRQEAPRLFINNIVLRFHRSLQLEEDENKTIVCRYPPPQAPEPPPAPGIAAKILEPLPEPAKLTQYEPFMIIAALLFFALILAGVGTTSYVTKKQVIKPINTPFPITSHSAYDDYVDNKSTITTEEVETTAKTFPLPKLSTHTVEDVFMTNIHEIDTEENLVYHKQFIPKPHLEYQNYDATYITNEEKKISEEILNQRRLGKMKNLKGLDCDDAFLTNQDEIIEDEKLTSQKMLMSEPKIEIRTIEDTFITKFDEVVEREDTTYRQNLGNRSEEHYEEYEEYRSDYRNL